MQKSDVRVTVSIPALNHQRLLGIAEQSGVSLSWIVRYSIEEFLRQNGESQQVALPLLRHSRNEK